MVKSKEICALLVLAACVLEVNAEVKTLSFRHHYNNSQLFFEKGSVEEATLTYGLCNKTSVDQPEKLCVFVREGKNMKNETEHVFCKLILKDTSKPDGIVGPRLRVVPFDSSKFVVFWTYRVKDDLFFKFSTINHVNDCQVLEAEVPATKEDDEIFEDIRFVPIYYETTKSGFNNLAVCKRGTCNYKIDPDGKIVNANISIAMIGRKLRYFLKTPFSIDKLRAFVKFTVGYYFFEVDEIDVLKMVEKVHLEPQRDIVYSTSQDTIGLCFSDIPFTYECYQYNVKTERAYVMKPHVSVSRRAHGVAMYNLPDGYLFANNDCEGPVCFGPQHEYFIAKFDVNGNLVASMSFTDFECEFDVHAHFFKRESDGYCLSLVCYEGESARDHRGLGHLSFMAKCFGEEDLKE